MTFLLFFKIAIMNQTDILYFEIPFSHVENRKPVNTGSLGKMIRFEKDLGSTINNYLKTPEEIDAEFTLEMTNNKNTYTDHKDHLDSYGRIIYNINNNTYSPDYTHSGFMEENY